MAFSLRLNRLEKSVDMKIRWMPLLKYLSGGVRGICGYRAAAFTAKLPGLLFDRQA
jgi:hypothetical protein